MAAQKPEATPVETDEWETVAEARSKMIFDTDGDTYTGVWEGFEVITDPNTGEEYLYANFRNAESGPTTTSAGYQLKRALEKIDPGRTVRLIRTGSTVVDKNKNPMTDFKVLVKKN